MYGVADLRAQFRERAGYELDLDNPQAYCEKIQWRKVYDRRAMLPRYADKIGAREVVAESIGADYLVPSPYSSYEEPTTEEIKAHMPGPCVIKAAHGCAWMIFQGARGKYLSAKEIKKHVSGWIANTYGQEKLQWAESQIEPGVIVEQYMGYRGGQCPLVKVYCFDGTAKLGESLEHGCHSANKRAEPKTVTFYDQQSDLLDLRLSHIPATPEPAPDEYSSCLTLSEKLSAGIDHVRVDWLLTDDGPKFSEFTWYPTSGMFRFEPPEFDSIMGAWWALPKETA